MLNSRIVYASRDTGDLMRFKKQKKLSVYSFFPIDKPDCACRQDIIEIKDKLAITHPKDRDDLMRSMDFKLECKRDKTGMKRFVIICKSCNELQGYLYAYNKELLDWCDFHYFQYTDGIQWFGCLTPNISPIDLNLTIECTCGQDTRDFRANRTLPSNIANRIEEENKIGRTFNTSKSKFKVLEMGVEWQK